MQSIKFQKLIEVRNNVNQSVDDFQYQKEMLKNP